MPKRIVVLGSEGQIGKSLCLHLKNAGHTVLKVDNRDPSYPIDLRYKNTEQYEMFEYWLSHADYVFFLAYEVGGAKFLSSKGAEFNFIQSNMQIMSNVFDSLKWSDKPFFFASSIMAAQSSSYGRLKKLGEACTKSVGNGISGRFWNVYGPYDFEQPEEKWHVIPHFVKMASHSAKISMLTSGKEERQFVHIDDACDALEVIMEHHDDILKNTTKPVPITTGQWNSVSDVANAVALFYEHYYHVDVIKGPRKDLTKQKKIEPKTDHYFLSLWNKWQENDFITLEQGVVEMCETYERTTRKI